MLMSLLLLISFAHTPQFEHEPTDIASSWQVKAPPVRAPGPEALAASNRSSMPFTRKQKQLIKQENAEANGGKTRCATCIIDTVPGLKHVKGVTPPANETQVDHKLPKAKGGAGDVDNGQVLCRKCNIKKGSKIP